MISAYDIIFNETKRYKLSDVFDQVTKEHVQPLKIKSLEGIEDEASIKLPTQTLNIGTNESSAEYLLDVPYDTIIIDSRDRINHSINLQLLSPEITPEPKAE